MGGVTTRLLGLLGLEDFQRGLLGSVFTVVFISLVAGVSAWHFMPRPSAALLYAIAGLGGTLLIAYVLEVTWLVEASRSRPLEERENRLGALVGVAATGLVGIVLALALSERSRLNHWEPLDHLGFGFVLGGILMLGIAVVMQPWIVHEWIDKGESSGDSTPSEST